MGAALPFIGLGATLLGGATQISGQQQSAAAAKAEGRYRQQVALNNQLIARRNAEEILRAGRLQEEDQRFVTAGEMGSARAGASARGVEVDTGSASDILGNIAATGEQDALRIRNQARRAAADEINRARALGAESEAFATGIKSAQTASDIASAGTALDTAGTVASRWYSYRK